MAITLLADIAATDTLVHVTDAGFASRRFPFPALIGAELVIVRGGGFDSAASDGSYHLFLDRGADGSTAASHSASATIDPINLAVSVAFAKAAHVAVVAGTTPAGGEGATEGAYDTAVHRDALIATVAELKAQLNAVIAALVAAGLMAAS
jgi:hypothetical protein